MSFKKICICLILIFCIIGAASAAEDVSADVVDFADDSVAVDAVSDDVSDSLESVDDEAVVDDSVSAQDEIDDVELEASVDDEPALEEIVEGDSGQSPNILKDEIDYLTPTDDILTAISNIEENGIIYLSTGEFFIDGNIIDSDKNYTIIGQSRDDTKLIKRFEGSTECQGVKTFINMTIRISEPLSDDDPIQTVDLESNSVFINCTFIGTPINMGKNLFDMNIENHGGLDYEEVYSAKFYNCEFLNSDRDNTYTKTVEVWDWDPVAEETVIITTVYTLSSYLNVFDHAIVELYDCTFENLNYGTLICTNVANYDTGSVKIYNATFKNCAMNAVVDYYTDLEDIVAIEDCDYDFDATTGVIASEDGAHHYVNATKLAKPDTTLVADVDDAGNLLVSLTVGGSAVANGKVLISVNGAEAVSW